MTFTSPEFFIFICIVYSAFRLSPDRFRWFVLLVASIYFYMAIGYGYLVVALLSVTLASYVLGILISKNDSFKRIATLWAGIILVAIVLLTLKYYNYLYLLIDLYLYTDADGSKADNSLTIIGVSYYTFQAISYLVDIYFGKIPPEKHFGYFSLYIMFFPRILQGPIERAGDFIHQTKAGYRFSKEVFRDGCLLFALGLFKKIVIADRLAIYVNAAYGDPAGYSGFELLVATYAYAFQIYFDFSGYTDMALGSARLFNIKLTQNFNAPYLATSVADFWRRWHISFSRWILDYLFKPMQFIWRGWGLWGTALALLMTFLISGLWHGTGWGYLVWGGLHGTYMATSVLVQPFRKRIYRYMRLEGTLLLKSLKLVFTFHLICFAWIFFRSETFSKASYIISKISTLSMNIDWLRIYEIHDFLIFSAVPAYLYLFNIVLTRKRLKSINIHYSDCCILLFILISILVLYVPNNGNDFIYFRF